MSKGFFTRILDAVGIEEEQVCEEDTMMDEEETYPEDVYEEEPEPRSRRNLRQQSKVVSMPNPATKMQMLLFQPCSLEEAEAIIDSLKARKPVVMNLDELDVELGQRILDFVGGAVYSLGGDIRKVARSIFVVAPSNVDVSQSIEERSGRDSFRRFD